MRNWVAAAADLAAIVAFAAVGRASHDEGLSLLGIAETAWPFLAGWVLAAAAVRAWRRPEVLTVGAALWIGSVAGGMLFRLLTGAGTAPAFVVVATTTLGLLLLGWRAGYALVARPNSGRLART